MSLSSYNIIQELDTVRQESERLRTQLEMLCDELENKKNQIIECENEIKHLVRILNIFLRKCFIIID